MQISSFVFLKQFKFFTYVIKLAFATCVPEGEVDAVGVTLALDLETIERLAYFYKFNFGCKTPHLSHLALPLVVYSPFCWYRSVAEYTVVGEYCPVVGQKGAVREDSGVGDQSAVEEYGAVVIAYRAGRGCC